MNDLSSERALVTSASAAIGRDIAVELARRGARVAVHYANSGKDAYETVQDEV